MAKSNVQESQQQGQGITIGTQGNEDQPTPLGDNLHQNAGGNEADKHIPNQGRSSASNQRQAGNKEQND